jgi:hypothetical protein
MLEALVLLPLVVGTSAWLAMYRAEPKRRLRLALCIAGAAALLLYVAGLLLAVLAIPEGFSDKF